MSIQRTSSTSSEETRSPVNPPQQGIPQVRIPAASGTPSSEIFSARAQAILQTITSTSRDPAESFKYQLDKWIQEDPSTRAEAGEKILRCFRDESSLLNLSELPITSLPECFANLSALKYLNLSYTRLQALPECFASLSALTCLSLSYTQLQILPDSFGRLSTLEVLHLSHTPIQTLPDSFGGLSA